jgi:protein tyrosine phosphatase (PTP) superfamily phosphohydrolase (DUF442 family)
MSTRRRVALPLILALLAGGCAAEKSSTTATATPAAPAQCDLNNPATQPNTPTPAVKVEAKADAAASLASLGVKKVETPTGDAHPAGPHNLWWLRQPGAVDKQGGLLSGGVPEGDADFAHLTALGIKTVISVDGASPDVEAAARRGMSYIHIPTQYSAVEPEQQLEVARAIAANLHKGSVYIHCHHGKHRSPAQAAAAAVGLGWMSADQAVAFMKQAGTAESYTGLYTCVAESKLLDRAAITAPAQPGEFVPIRKPDGLVGAMIEVDSAYEHLGQIKGAGWKAPKDHPDLVAADEAGRLADHLRFSGEDARARAHGDDFMKRLAKAVTDATALEEAIIKKADAKQLDTLWTPVVTSCKDCHRQYRDKR